jgi:hypothetical protein
MDFKNCSELELWEYVCTRLKNDGINTVLVGGAVAAIYSKGAYKSGDLDIVINSVIIDDKKVAQSMANLGFAKSGRHWIHPDCKHLYIEFIRPPIAIGDDYRITPVKRMVDNKEISILSPEDCVRDRLSSYVYFKAAECFDQAVMVAKEQKIDINKIQEWAKNEGKEMVEAIRKLMERVG